MKVIRKGSEKTYEVTCDFCKSDLEYMDEDVFFKTEEKRGLTKRTVTHLFKEDEEYIDIRKKHYRCVVCPVCNNTIKMLDVDSFIKDDDFVRWERVR